MPISAKPRHAWHSSSGLRFWRPRQRRIAVNDVLSEHIWRGCVGGCASKVGSMSRRICGGKGWLATAPGLTTTGALSSLSRIRFLGFIVVAVIGVASIAVAKSREEGETKAEAPSSRVVTNWAIVISAVMSTTESGSSGSAASNQLQLNVKGKLLLCRLNWSHLTRMSLGPSELKLQITIDADKSVKDLKEAIAKNSDVEADRQRLIYSGQLDALQDLALY